jgi:hypothetical protein
VYYQFDFQQLSFDLLKKSSIFIVLGLQIISTLQSLGCSGFSIFFRVRSVRSAKISSSNKFGTLDLVHPFLSNAYTRRGPDSAVNKATQPLWPRKTEVLQFRRSSTSEVFYGLCQFNRLFSTTCLNSSDLYLSMAITSLCFLINLHVISSALKEVFSLNMFIMRMVCISASRTEQDMSQTHLVQQHSR